MIKGFGKPDSFFTPIYFRRNFRRHIMDIRNPLSDNKGLCYREAYIRTALSNNSSSPLPM
ncbi:hypothetical protein DN748_10045 [Sinomicrobium soli]|nr:hypothetical protein DN748_10045 [Sinomicrobium sp. N-1-3-6]